MWRSKFDHPIISCLVIVGEYLRVFHSYWLVTEVCFERKCLAFRRGWPERSPPVMGHEEAIYRLFFFFLDDHLWTISYIHRPNQQNNKASDKLNRRWFSGKLLFGSLKYYFEYKSTVVIFKVGFFLADRRFLVDRFVCLRCGLSTFPTGAWRQINGVT